MWLGRPPSRRRQRRVRGVPRVVLRHERHRQGHGRRVPPPPLLREPMSPSPRKDAKFAERARDDEAAADAEDDQGVALEFCHRRTTARPPRRTPEIRLVFALTVLSALKPSVKSRHACCRFVWRLFTRIRELARLQGRPQSCKTRFDWASSPGYRRPRDRARHRPQVIILNKFGFPQPRTWTRHRPIECQTT